MVAKFKTLLCLTPRTIKGSAIRALIKRKKALPPDFVLKSVFESFFDNLCGPRRTCVFII
jgi:hypothetical protein